MSVLKRKILKKEAIRLRIEGFSYSYIMKELHLPKSTISDWVRNIKFKPNQVSLEISAEGIRKSAETKSRFKKENVRLMRYQAREEIGKITSRDLLMFGIGLYLGEGAKAIESVRVINSDPRVIKMAIKWFLEIIGLRLNNLSLALHSYPDNDINEDIAYWSRITGIPKSQFGKTQVDMRNGKRSRNKLPHGTVQLRVLAQGEKLFGVALHRKIMGWIDAVCAQG